MFRLDLVIVRPVIGEYCIQLCACIIAISSKGWWWWWWWRRRRWWWWYKSHTLWRGLLSSGSGQDIVAGSCESWQWLWDFINTVEIHSQCERLYIKCFQNYSAWLSIVQLFACQHLLFSCLCWWAFKILKINNSVMRNRTEHNTTERNTTEHNRTQHNATQHNTAEHNTTERNTTQQNATQQNATQHNRTQHNRTQHNTTQHSTTEHNTTEQNATQHSRTRHEPCSALASSFISSCFVCPWVPAARH